MTLSVKSNVRDEGPERSAALVALEAKAAHVAARLAEAANPKRLLILCHLAKLEQEGGGEASVGALQKEIGLSQSALSQHLAVLRREKLVATRRQAQFIHYSLASEDVQAVLTVLYERFCAPDANPPE